jgi:AbrB family looped-hinge helix DNA binding protein
MGIYNRNVYIWGKIMNTSVVTAKGQIVIPAKLRRKLGMKKGTPVSLSEQDGVIMVQPVTDEYLRSLQGILGTKGKLLKALLEEKKKEREL